MIDDVHLPGGLPQLASGVEIPLDEADARGGEPRRFRRRADQGGDLVALGQQGVDEVAADKTGAAGDERPHNGRSYIRSVL